MKIFEKFSQLEPIYGRSKIRNVIQVYQTVLAFNYYSFFLLFSTASRASFSFKNFFFLVFTYTYHISGTHRFNSNSFLCCFFFLFCDTTGSNQS